MKDVLFLGLFNLIGGIAVGVALRRLFARQGGWLFLLIWGLGFGGLPLIFGLQTWTEERQWQQFLMQLIVFFGAIVIAAAIQSDLFSAFTEGPVVATGAGSLLFLAGIALAVTSIKTDLGQALLGLGLAATGVWLAWRTVASELKKEATGDESGDSPPEAQVLPRLRSGKRRGSR